MTHNLYAVTHYKSEPESTLEEWLPDYSVNDLEAEDTPRAAIEYLRLYGGPLDINTGFSISPLTKGYIDLVTVVRNEYGQIEMEYQVIK